MLSGFIILINVISNNNINLNNNEKEIINKIKQYRNELELKENIFLENIKGIIDYLISKIKIDFNLNENNKKIYEFLKLLNKCPESIEFIKDKKIYNISNLIFFWLDSNDSGLFAYEINNFIKIIEFFEKLHFNKNKESIFEIIKKIIDGVLYKDQYDLSFREYINNYKKIHFLFDKYLSPTDGCIKKIKYILKKSTYYISLTEKIKKYEIKGQYEILANINDIENLNFEVENNKINNEKKYDYLKNIELLEEFQKSIFIQFKELEILEQRLIISKISENEINLLNIYIIFFRQIKELLNILNDLYSKGYPGNIYIKIFFYKTNIICLYNENIFELKKLLIYFKNVKKSIKSIREMLITNNNSIINLFFGRQINLLYNNIKRKKDIQNLDLLKVMTNNNINMIISEDSLYVKMNELTEFYSIVEVLEEYISDLLENNNKTIKDIYLDNEIKEEYNKYNGIYFYISLNQDIDSLFIYQKLTDKLPINACFLYCTPETTSEELIVFLYRSMCCKNPILFCIINTELLNYFQSRLLINIIKKLTKYNIIKVFF